MTYKEFRKKCPAKYCGEITGEAMVMQVEIP